MALVDDYDLTQNDVYLHRIQMALVSTAIAIQSEATNTANHSARSAFAMQVLTNPIGYAKLMAPGMAADGATTAASTDAQLKNQASAIFNAYCVQS